MDSTDAAGEYLDRESDAPDDLLGNALHDTYLIQRVIGEGGMGRVYEAHHTRIPGKRFAVKVLRAEMMHSPELRTRFQREAQAAATILHPNVIGVHDFGHTPDGRPYLVAEFLEGTDLRERVERGGPLGVELSVFIARRVCDAIQAAHVHGVIHRDMKPENIFLIGPPDRPLVKVLDFGLSRFMEAGPSSTVTRTGVVMGTPSYMAPEQARGERVDHRVDIYGVGVLLYVALTGQAPFNEETPQQTVLAVLSTEPTRPRRHNPAIPEGLEVIIQRAMAREIADRYPSAADLDAALSLFDTLERPLGARPQLLSRVGSDEVELGSARTELALLVAFGALLGALMLVTVVAGLPRLFGWRPLTALELSLILTAVVGTGLTPLLLAGGWLRRRVWTNSLRTVELVPALRAPIITAAAALGSLALLGYAVDTVASELSARAWVTGVAGWGGWGPLIIGVALIAGLNAAFRRRLLERPVGSWRRIAAGTAILLPSALGAFALLRLGIVEFAAQRAASEAAAERAVPVAVPIAVPSARAAAPVVPAAASSAPIAGRASALELEAARGRGLVALERLGALYPDDPPVLEALALARARDPALQARTLAVLERLFTLDPARAAKKELSDVVLRLALGRGDTAAGALDVMADHMGATGVDLLYDLFVTSAELRLSARERLDRPAVQAHMTPALAVTYALRTAKNCEDRLPLLVRAVAAGDERTVALLRGLAARTKRGCGWKKSQPCAAACPLEAARFDRAATELQLRLTAAAQDHGR